MYVFIVVENRIPGTPSKIAVDTSYIYIIAVAIQ